jgi:signal transduction histidine kinase/streptogramin lyase
VLVEEENGDVWAAGDSIVYRIDRRKHLVLESHILGAREVTSAEVCRHKENVLWIGTWTGLFRIADGILTVLSTAAVHALKEDSRGDLWIGTQDGLVRMHAHGQDRVEFFRQDPKISTTLSHNIVTALFEDRSASLWVGTYKGVSLFDRFSPAFTVYRSSSDPSQGPGDSFVIPIVEDQFGSIWFGTFSAGVSVLQTSGPKAGTFTQLRDQTESRQSPSSNNIRSILSASDGRVWVASLGRLSIYNAATRKLTSSPINSRYSEEMSGIECMCEGEDGSVWFPLRGRLRNLRADDSMSLWSFQIPELDYASIFRDMNGMIWLGTIGGGLIRFDPGTESVLQFRHEPGNPTSLSNNNVWTVFESVTSTSRTLWIGTSNGLNRMDPTTGSFTRYLEQDGFPNPWVYGILPDDSGRLWLSTNQGLVLFDERLPEGRQFRNYTHADGIAGNEFNRRSYCRLRNGDLLFGGPDGVTRFRPSEVQENPAIPPLVLTGFTKLGKRVFFDQDVAEVSSVSLNHDESVFSFDFIGLHFSHSTAMRYAYRMEGLDVGWINAGNHRSVNYAYLPPGGYVFRVRASHRAGVWNPNELAVQVIIHPPFWATWWFIALCVCVVAGIVTIVVRARIRRLLEIERLRSRIARDLHDEIGSNLSSIAMASDLLGRQSDLGDRHRSRLTYISSVALATVKEMRDMVWLINPKNDALDDLFLRMKDTAASLLEGRTYSVNFPEAGKLRRVTLDWKQNLYLIYKEGLTNIAKHSGATEVRIELRIEGDRLILELADNGAGFDPASSNGGNGLRNMKDRSALLGGNLEITSTGEGTTLRLDTRIT